MNIPIKNIVVPNDLILDVFIEIMANLDNKTLEELSLTSLKNKIFNIIGNNRFWHLRTEIITRKKLYNIQTNKKILIDWKIVYYDVLKGLENNNIFVYSVENGNLDTIAILLENNVTEIEDDDNIIYFASRQKDSRKLKLLLEDGRFNPAAESNQTIIDAVKYGNFDMVKLLAKDQRVDPSDQHNESIISAVKNDDGYNMVKFLLKDKRVDPSDQNNKAIIKAVKYGDIKLVQKLFNDPRVDPSAQNNKAIVLASYKGYTDIVKLFLSDPRVDPSVENNVVLRNMVKYNNPHLIKLLLQYPRVNPADYAEEDFYFDSVEGWTAIIYAACYNQYENVKILLQDPRVDPSDMDNSPIILAAKNGGTKIVKLLLQHPLVDPTDQDNLAIRFARDSGNSKIVKLLLKDPRIDPFVDCIVYSSKKYKNIIKNKISNSIGGLIAGSSNNLYEIIGLESDKQSVIFINKFALYIVKFKVSIISCVQYLGKLIKMLSTTKIIINHVIQQILHPNKKFNNKLTNTNLYVAIRGFLLLCYTPEYTYQEIIQLLKKEGHNNKAIDIAGGLVGAYMGLEKLIIQKVNIPKTVDKQIDLLIFKTPHLLHTV
jgi:SHS2 domain-containing protein